LLAIQNVLRGDTSAFSVIFRLHSAHIYSLARRYGNGPEDSEEVVQEVFLRAYRALPKFQISKELRPWLTRIALNHLRSLHRYRNRKKRPVTINFDVEALNNVGDGKLALPSDTLQHREHARLVNSALSRLRPVYRKVFVLRILQGISVSEVAETLGLPEGTVKTYTHRARRKLIDIISGRPSYTSEDFRKNETP
jgi:RNA polymerase sigma-70 factor (ECF subfamily)